MGRDWLGSNPTDAILIHVTQRHLSATPCTLCQPVMALALDMALSTVGSGWLGCPPGCFIQPPAVLINSWHSNVLSESHCAPQMAHSTFCWWCHQWERTRDSRRQFLSSLFGGYSSGRYRGASGRRSINYPTCRPSKWNNWAPHRFTNTDGVDLRTKATGPTWK